MANLWESQSQHSDCETMVLQGAVPGYVAQEAVTTIRRAVVNRGDTELHDTPLCAQHAAWERFIADVLGHLVRERQAAHDMPERGRHG